MTHSVQVVVYRRDAEHEPSWQFHSMPESIVGGAMTLAGARAEYRDALSFSLESTVLPVIQEYVEHRVSASDIWMRFPIDHPNIDGLLSEMQRQIEARPDHLGWFMANPTAGGDPVVVAVPADAPLSLVLRQMTSFDSLIVAVLSNPPSGGRKNMLLSLAGADTKRASEPPLTSFGEMGLTPESPLRELLRIASERQPLLRTAADR